jgi:hypothetical protein
MPASFESRVLLLLGPVLLLLVGLLAVLVLR